MNYKSSTLDLIRPGSPTLQYDKRHQPSRCKRVNKTNYLVDYPRNRDLPYLINNLYNPYLQKRRNLLVIRRTGLHNLCPELIEIQLEPWLVTSFIVNKRGPI